MSTLQNAINANAGTPLSPTQGGIGVSNPTAHGILVGEGSSAVNPIVLSSNGELLIGSSGADPVAATITPGTGISITNGAGSITIAATESGPSFVNVTGTTQTLAANTVYMANNASVVTFTLPATAAIGDYYKIVGYGAGGWTVAQNASQQINVGNEATTSGTGGSVSSSNQYDAVEIYCGTANDGFVGHVVQGQLTVV
jgi:hypothetical protein